MSGCVSAGATAGRLDDQGDLVVVERSKALSPAWAAAAPGTLTETPTDLRMVTVRSKLLNLPLGLKQAQLAGVEALRDALIGREKARLLAAAADRGVAAPQRAAPGGGLERALQATADDVAGRYVRVADLYFEKIENHALPSGDPMASYHVAYVLAVFPKDHEPTFLDVLARRLQAEGPALRPLGLVAKSLASPAKGG